MSDAREQLGPFGMLLYITILCVSSLLVLIYFSAPIQPDEITTLYNNSRYIVDNYAYIPHYRTCSDSPLDIPALITPISYFNSLYSYIGNPLALRIVGVAPYIMLCISLGCYVSSRTPQKIRSAFIFTVYFALVLFFFTGAAVWNFTVRAEHQSILSLALLIAALAHHGDYSTKVWVCRAFYVSSLFVWLSACYQHPKAIYFAPLFLMVGLLQKPGKLALLIGIPLIGYILSCIIKFDVSRFTVCEENPGFSEWLKLSSINPVNAFLRTNEYISEFSSGWAVHWSNLFGRAANNLSFAASPDIGYLPQVVQEGYSVNIVNLFIRFIFYAELHASLLIVAVALIYPVLSLRIINNRAFTWLKAYFSRNLAKKVLWGDWIFISMLMAVVLVIISHNRTNNSYDVQFWHIIMTSGFIMMILPDVVRRGAGDHYRIHFLLVSLLMIASLYVSYTKYYKTFSGAWSAGTFSGPNLPLKMLDNKIKDDISSLYKSCASNNKGLLIVDDRTYFPLRGVKNIGLVTYMMLPSYFGRTRGDGYSSFNQYMRRNRSALFIGACAYRQELPPAMKSFMVDEKYDICCFNFKE